MLKLAIVVGVVGGGAGAWLVVGSAGSWCCDDPPRYETPDEVTGESQTVTTLDTKLDALRDDETIGKPVGATPAAPKIELLGLPDCPGLTTIRANLKAALAVTGGTFTEVNLLALPTDDPRRGWPSPTILVDGHDLFGLPAPESTELSCRDCPEAVPNADAIRSRLSATER